MESCTEIGASIFFKKVQGYFPHLFGLFVHLYHRNLLLQKQFCILSYEASHISYIRLHNYNAAHQKMFQTKVIELDTVYILWYVTMTQLSENL